MIALISDLPVPVLVSSYIRWFHGFIWVHGLSWCDSQGEPKELNMLKGAFARDFLVQSAATPR